MAGSRVDDLTHLLKDAAYVSVGLSVIALQRAQVRRQELETNLRDTFGGARGNLDETVERVNTLVDDRVKLIEERLEAVEQQVDAVLDEVETRLPEPVADASRTARAAAKAVRGQVLDLVNRER